MLSTANDRADTSVLQCFIISSYIIVHTNDSDTNYSVRPGN